MQLLLRKYTLNSQGDAQLTDTEFATEALILGSAPDADIQLLGKKIIAQHATIRQTQQGLVIQANKGCYFFHNGKEVTQAILQKGDQLLFAQHALTLIEPPTGFDVALQWQPAEVDGGLLANAYQTHVKQTGFRPRTIAWLLAGLIFIFAGVVPVVDYLWRSGNHSAHEKSTQFNSQEITQLIPQEITQRSTQQTNAESFWTSGPLHSAHRVAIGNQCESCHKKAFQQVTDQACVACHSEQVSHVLKGHDHAGLLEGLTCQSCHKEHNEPAQLINTATRLCTNCHKKSIPAVTGFNATQHPEFKLSLLVPNTTERVQVSADWAIQRLSAALPNSETSHLKFSHQNHLNSAKVHAENSEAALECSQCHQLQTDKEHFAPINMEKNCSSCHALSFDAAHPQKQLPHGNAENIYPTLETYFLNLAFNKGNVNQDQPARRLPARTQEVQSCEGNFACAQSQALAETDRQFSKKGCITCHEVTQVDTTDARARWQVLPIKLASDWYPAAHFNHQSHLTQRGESGNKLCTSCHDATTSTHSQDVLIPAIKNCINCHGDQSSNNLPLDCVSCHAFHPSALQRSFKLLELIPKDIQ